MIIRLPSCYPLWPTHDRPAEKQYDFYRQAESTDRTVVLLAVVQVHLQLKLLKVGTCVLWSMSAQTASKAW